jgi:hypothetical protein
MNSPISSTNVPGPGAPTSRRLGVEPQLAANAPERPPHQPIAKGRDDVQPASIRKGLAISAWGSGSRASSRPGRGRPARRATRRSSLDELLDAVESWISDHQGPVPKVRKGRRNPPLTANQMADLALTHLGTQHIQRVVIDIAHTTKKREKQHLLLLVEWLTTFGMVDISIDFSLNSPARRFKPPKRPTAKPSWTALNAAAPEGSTRSVPAALECASCPEGAGK